MEADLITATTSESASVESNSADVVRELSSLELSLVGGGTGSAIFM